jgi:predicted nucleic acid-binding protein
MADLLVDTDVFVDHLRGSARFRPGAHRISYSVITREELFAGRGSDEEAVRRLLGTFVELGIDREVAETGGRIRRETGITLPDALIAATALAGAMPLVTRNRLDFDKVKGLRIRSPLR